MKIQKDSKLFRFFEKNYWEYYLELEEQFISTKRYVAFDAANYKSYSLEYLKLLEAVCSEIDIVGKEIAHQIDSSFKILDISSNIQKWWFIIQNWYSEKKLEPVAIFEDLHFSPWQGYKIVEYINKKGVRKLKLKDGSKTPDWWASYNKVKHSRTLADPDTQEQFFHRANLGNLCNAFSALYLLEKRYMEDVGRAEEYNRCKRSRLFDNQKPMFYYDEDGRPCQYVEE